MPWLELSSFVSDLLKSSLLWDLIKAYVLQAWPFALLHLLILVVIVRDHFHLRSERRALTQYQDTSSESEKDELAEQGSLTRVLRQFERESERLGRQGLIAPMTDFSDRLDAEVEQKVSRVYDYAGLLLTIGIAGTMFGVFEFAFRAGTVLQGAGTSASAQLSEFLAGSMAKAFPVGVMGLFWMLAAQMIASREERQLQRAVSQTTMQVLSGRAERITSPGQKIEDSAERIEEVANSIERGLEPIRDLKGTIKEGVTPIVEELSEQLQEAVGVIERQSEEMRETNERVTEGMTEIVEKTSSVVEDMREETKQLKSYLEDIPEVVEQTKGLQSRQHEVLAEIDESSEQLQDVHRKFDQAAVKLQTTSETLDALPDRFEAAHSEAADTAQRKAIETWRANYEEIEAGLQVVHENFLREIQNHIATVEEKTTELPDALDEAAEELSRVARKADTVMNERFMEAVHEALSIAENQIDEKLMARYPEAVDRIDELTSVLDRMSERLEQTSTEVESSLRHVADVTEDIDALEERVGSLINESTDGNGEAFQRQMEDLLDEVKSIRSNLTDSSRSENRGTRRKEKGGGDSSLTSRPADSSEPAQSSRANSDSSKGKGPQEQKESNRPQASSEDDGITQNREESQPSRTPDSSNEPTGITDRIKSWFGDS